MRTAECRTAIERLTAYIAHPQSAGADLDAALEHIHSCADCRGRIGYLVQALNTKAVDKLSCADCQDRLPAYIAVSGRAGAERRAVALHLALCPHCATAYADLLDLVELAEGRRGVEPPSYPMPDLSFLEPRRPWRLDDIGRLVITFTSELLASMLPPQPALAPPLKSGEPVAGPRKFTLAGEVEDQNITIALDPARGDPARYTVTVEVDIPSRGWPNLEGTLVTLRRAEAELASQATDAFGNAVFEQVAAEALPELVFVIERGSAG